MTTPRAVILSALLVAIAIGGAAWWSVPRLIESNRYSLVNAGGGVTMRLDRQSGKLIACKLSGCNELANGDKIAGPTASMPSPPPGFVLDK